MSEKLSGRFETDELSDQIRQLAERQNAQYTDIMLALQKISDRLITEDENADFDDSCVRKAMLRIQNQAVLSVCIVLSTDNYLPLRIST